MVRDIDDNRVLEAAVEGKCQYIITGDADLLDLKIFQSIKIITAEDFLKEQEV
ncbi:MAG TPA: putative toxin-antitoxin system toxin component, PIN family [Patescibacteria group bacterium]